MLTLWRTRLDTPIGPMLALGSEVGLCALEFDRPSRHERLESRLRRWFPPHVVVDLPTAPLFVATRHWLATYFAAACPPPADVRLDLRGAPFELRVWERLRAIPVGATSTYGAIARELGDAGASRAVGSANGANPVGIIVPCHRVIGSSGQLTGYGGGLVRKRWLLDHEAGRRSLFEVAADCESIAT